MRVGSVCSGIEAASVAWGWICEFDWFSETAPFPSEVLRTKFPDIPNLGDMTGIPAKIRSKEIPAPDLVCAGTPCQAFSLSGLRGGLEDDRGKLTPKLVEIVEACDEVRETPCALFWENVEGVLSDSTNAFGVFISALAGLGEVLPKRRWPNAGILRGPKRNLAWRVLDAKWFGVPQQRKRVYLLAGGKDFSPEKVLFQVHDKAHDLPTKYPDRPLVFEKDGHSFEVFRGYADCLFSTYGTRWNGNASAYNGSLFVVQDGRIRRFSPTECERLMGFPDGWTDLPGAKRTNRYKAIGNSWAVPVVRWIGERLAGMWKELNEDFSLEGDFIDLDKGLFKMPDGRELNCSSIPEDWVTGHLENVVETEVPGEIWISPVGSHGIWRRKKARGFKVCPRLDKVLEECFSSTPLEEIEKISLLQKRGKNARR